MLFILFICDIMGAAYGWLVIIRLKWFHVFIQQKLNFFQINLEHMEHDLEAWNQVAFASYEQCHLFKLIPQPTKTKEIDVVLSLSIF